MKEIWLDIEKWSGWYQVSNLGRVRSLARTVPMDDGRRYRVSAKILSESSLSKKYAQVWLGHAENYEMPLVHQLVLTAFVGPCPEGMECRHLDGNRRNNHLDNLCWGTRKQNGRDKIRHGTTAKGISNGNHILNEDQVRSIRNLFANEGHSLRSIARHFEIDKGTVSQIVTRRTWRHL